MNKFIMKKFFDSNSYKLITIDFPEDIYIKYKKISNENNKSFNSVIISTLQNYLNEIDKN